MREASLKLAQSLHASGEIGKARHVDKNAIFFRNTLGGVVSYCMRDKNGFGKNKCAHVSLLPRRESVL